MIDISKLAAPFPKEQVHWRVQGQPFERNGSHSAMALAYIDARDVMDRLDEVCGADNWQSEYVETAKGRIICRIGILRDSGWVWKSDGAGDTDVEGEKGALSDALKRAAVSWGIGRYLYRLDSPWVACDVTEKGGKKYWKRWTEDPWAKVRNAPVAPPVAVAAPVASAAEIATAKEAIAGLDDLQAFAAWWGGFVRKARHVAEHPEVIAAKDARKAELSHKEAA